MLEIHDSLILCAGVFLQSFDVINNHVEKVFNRVERGICVVNCLCDFGLTRVKDPLCDDFPDSVQIVPQLTFFVIFVFTFYFQLL